MGLFGKKKSPAKILAEGRALYEKGEYGKAALVLLKASGKENGEVDYWLGSCYLAIDAKKGQGPGKTAKQYLTFAAKAGHTDAARLLAENYGIRDYLPRKEEAKPADADDIDMDDLLAELGEMDEETEEMFEEMFKEILAEDTAPVSKPKPEPKPAPRSEPKTEPKPAPKAAPKPAPQPKPEPRPAPKPAPKPEPKPVPAQETARYLQQAEEARKAGNLSKALALTEKAAELGDAEAQFACGMMYTRGEGTPKNASKALYWLEKAAQQGNAEAQFLCGCIYNYDKSTLDKALYWFEQAAAQGDDRCQYNCGLMYAAGEGTAKNMKRAQAYFEQAAQSKDPDISRDAREELYEIYRPAADAGNMTAQYKLGQLYYDDDTYGYALYYFEEAAKQGHVEAQFMTGFLYEYGLPDDRDSKSALAWYKKAAENGYDFSQLFSMSDLQILASATPEQLCAKGVQIYNDGDDSPEHAAYALKFVELAANQGYVEAQYQCGCMYKTIGFYQGRDFSKAIKWFETASENGSGEASYACGELYEDKYGIYHMKDLRKAKQWYKKALQQGNEDARDALKEL